MSVSKHTALTGVRKPRCRRALVCRYTYRDIWGHEQFRKIRYRHDPCFCGKGKSFEYAWCPDPEEAWDSLRYKPPWADAYLYRLDEWWLDYRTGRISEVWWAEGEKDADALARVHLPATSHHQGAGNASAQQAAWFAKIGKGKGKGRRVVLVADLDDAGAYCAATRNNLLIDAGFRGEIRIVRAASGNDAADHLAAGHRPGEFVPVDMPALSEVAASYGPGNDGHAGYTEGTE